MQYKGKIFAIDDTPVSLQILSEMLAAEGYVVRSFTSGEAALEGFASDVPDLILLDIHMPGMDGFETCRRLKSNALTTKIPVIFLSSVSDIDNKLQGFSVGAVDYVNKPFYSAELMARVSKHLKLYQATTLLENEIEDRTNAALESEARFWTMVQHAPEAIFLIDADTDLFIEFNAEAERLTGRTRAEMIGLPHHMLYGPPSQSGIPELIEQCRRYHAIALSGEVATFEHMLTQQSGKNITCEVRLVRLPAAGRVFLRGSISDITERKLAEERALYLLHHDVLTGLANAFSVDLHLGNAIRCGVALGKRTGIIVLKLEGVKIINEVRGKAVGDALVIATGQRLASLIGSQGKVARRGGVEFIVVIDQLDEPARLAQIASTLNTAVSTSHVLDGANVIFTAYMGLSLSPIEGIDTAELIRQADTAMHHAKENGKNFYSFFEPRMTEEAVHRYLLEMDLREAIEQKQLFLVYQPQVDVVNRRVSGFEALTRWNHPQRGHISPADFIPIAEELGLIIPIGEWTLWEACRQMKAWQSQGLLDATIAVNLSAHQFRDENLLQLVQKVLSDSGLEPQYLELELTESCSMVEPEKAISTMHALRSLGVKISVDDFGTGYSSLAYLSRFPLHTLKIDGFFVRGSENDEKLASVCNSIAHLAQQLGMRVIAEGVETEPQLQLLVAAKCECFQGYFFSKPLPSADAFTYASSLAP